MNRRYLIMVVTLILLASLLVQCGTTEEPEPAEAPEPTEMAQATEVPPPPTDTPEEDKEVKIALLSHPNSLDPTFTSGRLSQAFLGNLYDSLTAHAEDGELQPGLAVSWEALDDTTWQFKLREGVKFHNGDPFTAADVKFSLDRILDPSNASPMAGRVGKIDHVEVVDDYTVNIVTQTPDVTLPVRLSELYGSVIPAEHVQEVGDEAFAKAPVGSGPFKFVEWVKDEKLVLEANEDYWRGAPKEDRIVVYPISEDSTRMAALQTGEVDVAANVPAFMVEELEANSDLEIAIVSSTRFFFITMRTDQPPFDDVRARQAVNYALDVPAVIDSVSYGRGRQLATIVIPAAFGFDASIEPYPYDVEKAKELLAEAGYPDGVDITFDSFTGSIVNHASVAEAIVGQLAEAGIRAELNETEFGVFKPTQLENSTNELYIYSFGEWAFDADNTFGLLLQTKSGYYYDDPDVLAKFEEERGTFDEAKRVELLKELQQMFYEESPYGYLYQLDTIWGMGDNVDYSPRIDELTWFFDLDIH